MTREEAKIAAHARAELALKHAMERIDHRHDVIKPRLEEHRRKAALQKGIVIRAELGAPDA